MSVNFIHLNLHTEYSIVDSIIRIDNLMNKCKHMNMPAVALTDKNNLFALVKFYKTAISFGIKPIIGIDVLLSNFSNKSNPFRLIILAQNKIGYKNILKLVSKSYTNGRYFDIPTINYNWLKELNEGLIILSGASYGDIGQALLSNNLDYAQKLLKFWMKIFPNRYYIEMQRVGTIKESEYLVKAYDLAMKMNVPIVATNAVRFLEKEDFDAHEARICIQNGSILNDPKRYHLYSEKQYFCSTSEMETIFSDLPEALANSVEIAMRCNLDISFGNTFLPEYPIKDKNILPNVYFENEVRTGLLKRLNFNSEEINNKEIEYLNRIEYEIKIINQMGFSGYFLIVADFINWAKKNKIPVGPGRGSGAGSLVAFSLGITDLDPLKHDLLFERFLNPERVSLPDFDIDFCMDGRDKVISYVVNHYGNKKVAQIITYGTMAAKAVVRDVGRVLGYSYGFVDKIAKLIPFSLGINLNQALIEEELLKYRYNNENEVKVLIDLAKKLEGIVRNASKHAGGVVIAPSDLIDFVPIYYENDSNIAITQFDKDDVEAIGLVKFDFLGLRTLTIINHTVQSINNSNKNSNIDISKINLEDKATYKLLQSGETTAIFQLESKISKDLIKRFKPDCFSDIVALVAIIRPGVLQSGMIDEIINRKHDITKISYLHPKLEPILKQTYGVAIYQEQVMQMAQSLAGYSLGSADLLRRAMGKKKLEEMALQRANFIDGAMKNKIDKHLANIIFDYMEKFASYGFNKSHSAAYALISYQTAWLKTHYPEEFMAAVLSSDMDNTDKIVLFLNECKKLKLEVIPPNINYSEYKFIVKENKIFYGLAAIKGVGKIAIEEIINSRKKHGYYKDLFDLVHRVDIHKVNKRVLESLVYSGAFDCFEVERSKQFENIDLALKIAHQHEYLQFSKQIDLFGDISSQQLDLSKKFDNTENWSYEAILNKEKKVLGLYLSGHPMDFFATEIKNFVKLSISDIFNENGKIVIIAGIIKLVKIINSRNGSKLAIVSIEDTNNSIDITVFSDILSKVKDILLEDRLIIVEGEVVLDKFSNNYRIKANKLMNLNQARLTYAKNFTLHLDSNKINDIIISNLHNVFSLCKGDCPVVIIYNGLENKVKLILGDNWKITPSEDFLSKINELGISGHYCY